MVIIRGYTNIVPRFTRAVVTIGNFDGVHRGHQGLFLRLQALSRRHHGAPQVAVTFEPHPRQFLADGSGLARITCLRAKVRLLGEMGVDALLVLRFNDDLAKLSAVDFVQHYLVEGLRVREVLVGENFRFGAGGGGNLEMLQRLGKGNGFGVHGQPLMCLGDTVISSSMVRAAVVRGDLGQAGAMLGRPFEIEGRVARGAMRGRRLGFPTANIRVGYTLSPPGGVWVVQGLVDGRWLGGVANLGVNPTFNMPLGQDGVNLETHLFDYDGDLYRRWLRVRFLRFIRSERKFSGAVALTERISQDIREARDCLAAINSRDQGVE